MSEVPWQGGTSLTCAFLLQQRREGSGFVFSALLFESAFLQVDALQHSLSVKTVKQELRCALPFGAVVLLFCLR
jgi:hypothetical protein